MNDLDLLAIQAEGSFDDRGRVAGWDGVKIACSTAGQALWIGALVPDEIAAELRAAFDRAPLARVPAEPPPALELCRRALADRGRALPETAGPSFLIDATLPIEGQVHLARSDAAPGEFLRRANPGDWHPVEWGELIDGRLGPWAMVIEGGSVVSICHTPLPLTPRGAECGVWTHPAFRGRGFGAAVVAAWAAIVRPSGRHLFYSTQANNFPSQRLAARMQLRPLGWTWRLGRASDADVDLHLLCTLRRRPT
jgi:RimJ/RimL family protein N-acetyltransferase